MLDQATLDLIEAARQVEPTPTLARRLIGLIDLTSLEPGDTPEKIDALCRSAVTPHGHVAAVCIVPGFVKQARAALAGTGVKVATVIDFPEGLGSPEDIMRETEMVVREGAEEIDVVFPYRRFLADTPPPASKNIRAVRDAGGYDIRVKAILEICVYPSEESLAQAAQIAIQGGADFLKTSTGKNKAGATLEAAAILLSEIEASGLPVGFKASGGVREPQSAIAYLTLAESIMGEGWAKPESFRIGASGLLPALNAIIAE
jgi:deoxyribose-phosphate aldolase